MIGRTKRWSLLLYIALTMEYINDKARTDLLIASVIIALVYIYSEDK